MKYIIALLFLAGLTEPSMGQPEPKLNDDQVLKKMKVTSLATYYYDKEDTTKSAKRLIFKKEFDNNGKVISKYHLWLWDVVSYSNTTTYTYDKNNNLVQKTIIQEILNLGKRDEEYIKALGDDPINEKFFYAYNSTNQLVKEEKYTFGKNGFDKSKTPDNTVIYQYSNGLLVKEVGTTPNGRLFDDNYTITYAYNTSKQKVKETKEFNTTNENRHRIVSWTYNDKGLLLEEIIDDRVGPFNNRHFKYEYDDKGRKIRDLQLVPESQQWEVRKTYAYDKNGNLILGDEETTFDYYKNGLVKSELWKSPGSDETVHFITTYKFR